MKGCVQWNSFFFSISVISGRCDGDNERLCARELVFFSVCQSYQDDGRMLIKGRMHWHPIYG